MVPVMTWLLHHNPDERPTAAELSQNASNIPMVGMLVSLSLLKLCVFNADKCGI